ncbi:MAG: hypothetical protein ACOY3E_13170 [Pseudomonadota bacterium]
MPFRAVLIACLLLLSACTSLPERPAAGRNGVGRVGYWVQLNDSPMHSHASGGMAGDYNRPYPHISWALTDYVNKALASRFAATTRFQLFDLKAEGYRLEDLRGLVTLQENQFTVADGKRALLARLRQQHALDFVVLIHPFAAGATSFCTPMGYCTSLNGIGTGLFTKSEMFGYAYKAVLGAQFDIYSLEPAATLSAYSPTTTPNLMFPINSFAKPASWKNITEQEWAPVKREVLAAADDLVNRVVNSLLGIDASCPYQAPQDGAKFSYGPRTGCVAQARTRPSQSE